MATALEKLEKVLRAQGGFAHIDGRDPECSCEVYDRDGHDIGFGEGPNLEAAIVDALAGMGELGEQPVAKPG